MREPTSGEGTTRSRAGWPLEGLYAPFFVGLTVGLAALLYVIVTLLTASSEASPPEPSAPFDPLILALATAFIMMAAGLVYLTWKGARRR